MKFLSLFGLLLANALTSPLAAQEAIPCDWIARADAIVEPWEAHTRTFANGDVRLALLDVIEPAAGAYHLLMVSPPYDELGARQCMTLGLSNGIGFSGVDWATLDAGYDPSVGLIWFIAVQVMGADGPALRTLQFTLNQSTGAIGAVLR